ncbi:MAG: hypothetical protein KatS3mg076_0207 [Candidatus Binatia bacterium]|nr:MAG: hypothetical protein KatS3mg076_0207 [Candidatus Binatia bacterium]
MSLRKVCLLALASAVLVGWAHAGPDTPKDPLCRLDCKHALRQCLHDAHADARLCRAECADLFEAARAACSENPRSEECRRARAEARGCGGECARSLRIALHDCFANARTCLTECPEREPLPPKDPECVGRCRAAMQECREAVREATEACVGGCEDLRDALRSACEEDPRSEECLEARRALHECLRPCRDSHRDGMRNCASSLADCVRSCPDRETESTE